MHKPYFKPVDGAPAPLEATVEQTVRFEECDPLGIVWHGRYTSYFEDARVALGERYGIGYMDFVNHDVVIPFKQMYHDYVKPLRFRDRITTKALLHWSDAARLNFEFIVQDAEEETVTRGYSVQLMLTRDFEVLLAPPPFYQKFCERWKAGELR